MIDKFETWLKQNGAEILPVSSCYERIRFKGKEVGILYHSGKFSNDYAKNAFECYKNEKKWDGKPYNLGRSHSYKKQKIQILKRDGDCCFYCRKKLNDDVTLEHLIALCHGGLNILGNMVLAHEKCNNLMGNNTLVEKVNFILKRKEKEVSYG